MILYSILNFELLQPAPMSKHYLSLCFQLWTAICFTRAPMHSLRWSSCTVFWTLYCSNFSQIILNCIFNFDTPQLPAPTPHCTDYLALCFQLWIQALSWVRWGALCILPWGCKVRCNVPKIFTFKVQLYSSVLMMVRSHRLCTALQRAWIGVAFNTTAFL